MQLWGVHINSFIFVTTLWIPSFNTRLEEGDLRYWGLNNLTTVLDKSARSMIQALFNLDSWLTAESTSLFHIFGHQNQNLFRIEVLMIKRHFVFFRILKFQQWRKCIWICSCSGGKKKKRKPKREVSEGEPADWTLLSAKGITKLSEESSAPDLISRRKQKWCLTLIR